MAMELDGVGSGIGAWSTEEEEQSLIDMASMSITDGSIVDRMAWVALHIAAEEGIAHFDRFRSADADDGNATIAWRRSYSYDGLISAAGGVGVT